jgi:hypothetical protein
MEYTITAWFSTGIWKLRWVSHGVASRICPSHCVTENAIHIILKYSEMQRTIFGKEMIKFKWDGGDEENSWVNQNYRTEKSRNIFI